MFAVVSQPKVNRAVAVFNFQTDLIWATVCQLHFIYAATIIREERNSPNDPREQRSATVGRKTATNMLSDFGFAIEVLL